MAKSKKIKDIKITIGLPGSGKTWWSTEEVERTNRGYYSSNETRCFDMDHYQLVRKYDENQMKSAFNSEINHSTTKNLIVDGLFLTYKDVKRLISLIDPKSLPHIKIHLEYWVPDIERCLLNDEGRREKNSIMTIKNGKVDEVNDEYITKLETDFPALKGSIIKTIHQVVVKPNWKGFAEKYQLHYDNKGIVKSSSWCLGGTWGNCWGDSGNVGGEPEPDEFDAFDTLLEKVCPNITFLQYKKICSEVISTETYSDGDYYGGSTTHAYKYFSIPALYDALKSRNLI